MGNHQEAPSLDDSEEITPGKGWKYNILLTKNSHSYENQQGMNFHEKKQQKTIRDSIKSVPLHRHQGKMPEWPIGAVSKTVVRVTVPRVRIPLFPQQGV